MKTTVCDKIVRLRCGLLANVARTDSGETFCIIGFVQTPAGQECECWTVDGFWRESKAPHDLDIIRWFD